jgi:hypothetical protein
MAKTKFPELAKARDWRERYAVMRSEGGPWFIHELVVWRPYDEALAKSHHRPDYTPAELDMLCHWLNERAAGYPPAAALAPFVVKVPSHEQKPCRQPRRKSPANLALRIKPPPS